MRDAKEEKQDRGERERNVTSAWLRLTVKDEQLPRGAKPLDGRFHAVDFFFVHIAVTATASAIPRWKLRRGCRSAVVARFHASTHRRANSIYEPEHKILVTV